MCQKISTLMFNYPLFEMFKLSRWSVLFRKGKKEKSNGEWQKNLLDILA